MESEKKKTVLCFDAINWLNIIFWNNDADLQYSADPWEALRYSDRTVGTFVRAARNADFELVAVAAVSATHPQLRAKYEWRREEEIVLEKRGVCLGADMFLAESFQKHGVRVVRPIVADATDVLAAPADSVDEGKGAIIVSRNRIVFGYDRDLCVRRDFTVRGGKLILDRVVTRADSWCPVRRSDTSFTVQPHLALSAMSDEEPRCLGHVAKYRPSLRGDGRVELGSGSSSDGRMGNLHVLDRPLRAAVSAILGERSALERSDDEKMVVWTETTVVADAALASVLKDPLSVVEFTVKHDKPVVALEPWRAAERHFNICALAAELVAVASHGDWTMHKCMELFSNDDEIIRRTSPSSPEAESSPEQEGRPYTSQDARMHFEEMQVFDGQKPTEIERVTSKNGSSSSRARESIFGEGRPREEACAMFGKFLRPVITNVQCSA